jgi:hypothetical protein
MPPEEGKTVHLVLDNASWHKAAALDWHHLKAVYLPPTALTSIRSSGCGSI